MLIICCPKYGLWYNSVDKVGLPHGVNSNSFVFKLSFWDNILRIFTHNSHCKLCETSCVKCITLGVVLKCNWEWDSHIVRHVVKKRVGHAWPAKNKRQRWSYNVPSKNLVVDTNIISTYSPTEPKVGSENLFFPHYKCFFSSKFSMP